MKNKIVGQDERDILHFFAASDKGFEAFARGAAKNLTDIAESLLAFIPVRTRKRGWFGEPGASLFFRSHPARIIAVSESRKDWK